MKKILLAVMLITGMAGYVNAQSTFVTTLGSGNKETGSGLVQTSDSGYVITGSTTINSNEDMFIAKFDKEGTLLWQKMFGGTSEEAGLAVAELPWGGLIFSGRTLTYASGTGGDVILVKTDANGDTLWTKIYGTSSNDIGRVIEVTPGGNYRITGTFQAGGINRAGLLLVDSNGIVLSSHFITNQFASPDYRSHYLHGNKMGVTGGSQLMMFTDTLGNYTGMIPFGSTAKSIDATYLPGGYYAIAHWADFGGPNINCGILLTDTIGTKIWDIKLVTTDDDLPVWIKPDGRGGILLGLSTRDMNYLNEMKLVALDMTGNIKWTKQYIPGAGNDHIMGNIINTMDGGYAMISSYDVASLDYNIALIKTDSLGNSGCDNITSSFLLFNMLESTPQPASQFDSQLENNGLRVYPPQSVPAVTLASHCNSITSVSEISNSISVNLWPNPVKNVLNVELEEKNAAYSILDITGREYQSGTLENGGLINVEQLGEGVYLLKIVSGNASGVTKFVKE